MRSAIENRCRLGKHLDPVLQRDPTLPDGLINSDAQKHLPIPGLARRLGGIRCPLALHRFSGTRITRVHRVA
jgi:hypothetical protein